MKPIIRIWHKIIPFIKNKYFLTLLIFSIWITFLDNNNLIERYKNIQLLKKIENECRYYKQRIITDNRKMYELKTDKQNLEKFAREQYLMKNDNEDLFIIVPSKSLLKQDINSK